MNYTYLKATLVAIKDTMLKLTVINELAWHNLFAKNMFIRPESKEEATKIKPNFTIVSAPHFKADPEVDGTKSETFVIISFKHKVILIGVLNTLVGK